MTSTSGEHVEFYILIVDDEEAFHKTLDKAFSQTGFRRHCVKTVDEAYAFLQQNGGLTIAVISDHALIGETGIDLRRKMMNQWKQIPFIIFSKHVSTEIALASLDLKICAFVQKPSYKELLERFASETRERIEAFEEITALSAYFISEAEEILEEFEPLILELEDSADQNGSLDVIFRLAHTLKGSSGVLQRPDFTAFLHELEEVLGDLKKGGLQVDADIISLLLKATDHIKQAIEELNQNGPFRAKISLNFSQLQSGTDFKAHDPKNSKNSTRGIQEASAKNPARKDDIKDNDGAKNTKSPIKEDTLTVPTAILDQFMSLSGEITVMRNMVTKLVSKIERRYPENTEIQFLAELLEEMHKVNSTIQKKVLELRKVSMSQVFRPLKRQVRDLENKTKKSIKTVFTGEKLRVDARIAKVLSGCLVHLIRNSIDHGIEDSKERLIHGKSADGHLELKCLSHKDSIILSIKDDGKGINPDKILDIAIQKQLISKDQAQELEKEEILKLIFRPGFSTAERVTDISGRGVGMDMVLNTIKDHEGDIRIQSELGEGTQIDIHLPKPKSVVIIPSLLVEATQQVFAIPQDRIIRLIKIHPDADQRWTYIQKTAVLKIDEDIFPIVSLNHSLELLATRDQDVQKNNLERTLILVSHGSREFAIEVDDIIENEEIVVKPLVPRLQGLGIFAGSMFTSDGTIGLILDIGELYKLYVHQAAAKDRETQSLAPKTINDSLSPTLEYMIFSLGEKHHYAIELEDVYRLERLPTKAIQTTLGRKVIVYRGQSILLIDSADCLSHSLRSVQTNQQDQRDKHIASLETQDTAPYRFNATNIEETYPLEAEENSSHLLEPRVSIVIIRKDDSYYGLIIHGEVDIISAQPQQDTQNLSGFKKDSLIFRRQIHCILNLSALEQRYLSPSRKAS